jgi:hypothetical protein
MALLTAVRRVSRIGRGLLVGLCAIAPVSALAATGPLEYAVKASYLYKFAPFVEWPPRAFAAPESPLRICIAGADPFGTVLADAVKGQEVAGHPVTVEHPDTPVSMGQCHILFVGKSPDRPPADMLRAVAGRPVLTVTDRSRGVSGGMIQFVLAGGRVRFMIDARMADASGVQISSKLLELAVKVDR